MADKKPEEQRSFTVKETDSLRGDDGKVRIGSDEFKGTEQVNREQAILNPEDQVIETTVEDTKTQTTAPMGDETEIEARQRVANLSNNETPITENPIINEEVIETQPVVENPVVEEEVVETPPVIKTPVVNEEVNPEEVVEKSQEQIFAEQNNIDFIKGDDGSFLFDPKTGEEAIDIGIQFGTDKINRFSLQNKSAQAVIAKYGKYKNAPKDVYTQGFKNNEIGVGGETWERLVKMNGGEPTAEMIQAQEEYDRDLHVDNINDTSNAVSGENPISNTPESDIEKLDTSYEKTVSNLFGELATNWKTFKSGNEKLTSLNSSLTETNSKIDELKIEKRGILKATQKRFPNKTLAQQLQISQKEISAVDDQLFVLQRQYNSDLATYKFEDTKAQGEFEYTAGLINKKMELAENIYGTQRGDLITKESIDRQDKLLSESIARTEQTRIQAIKDGDIERAKELTYDKDILGIKAKINKENQVRFTTANLKDGAVLKYDKFTGEETIVRADEVETPTSNISGSGLDFSTNTDIINKYPNEAAFKNNNPTGITSGASKELENLWKESGVSFGEGTSRPTNEGGTYYKFDTVEDGMKAYKIALTQRGDDVDARLQKWVGTSEGPTYSANLMKEAGIEKGDKFSELSEDQLDKLMSAQLKKESPNFFNELSNQDTPQEEAPSFTESRLARNSAIDLFIGGTEIKKTTDQRTAANQELVDEFGVQIEDFRTENKGMVDIFNRVVAGATSKTSDKEQVMNFNKAIAESALGDGSTQPMKNKIRATLLDDNVISEKLETAKDTTEVIGVIQDLFNTVTKDTGVTTKGLETIARTIGKSTGDEITSIDQITGKMLAAYVKSISGAAVTDQEFERLATQMPSLKDNPERFQLMLTNFKDETVRANTVKARQLLNDDTLFGELFPELSKEKKQEETGSSFRNRGRSPEVTNTTPSNNLKFNINK